MKINKTQKIILSSVIIIVVIALIYYLFFSKKSSIPSIMGLKKISQAEALEMSKTISNLMETENVDNINQATELINNLKNSGWVYVDYNQVTAV